MGKQALKLAYEHVRSMCDSASKKAAANRAARGPGVRGMGAGGGGDGEVVWAAAAAAIFSKVGGWRPHGARGKRVKGGRRNAWRGIM